MYTFFLEFHLYKYHLTFTLFHTCAKFDLRKVLAQLVKDSRVDYLKLAKYLPGGSVKSLWKRVHTARVGSLASVGGLGGLGLKAMGKAVDQNMKEGPMREGPSQGQPGQLEGEHI